MKKFFKLGLATLVPIALVAIIINALFEWFNDKLLLFLPESWGWQFWYVLVFIIGVAVAVTILGMILYYITPIRYGKNFIDKYIFERIPVVKTIYKFGKEISDSFIADSKFDDDLKIVEFQYSDTLKCIGLLTDPVNHIVASALVPNPMTGFMFKFNSGEDYRVIDMKIEEYLKLVASMGRIGGVKWDSTKKIK